MEKPAVTPASGESAEPSDLDVLRCHVEIAETLLALFVCTSAVERVDQLADGMRSLRATLLADEDAFSPTRVSALNWYINTIERAQKARRAS